MINNIIVKEERTIRIKRLSMRSMRRGTKEMDIILSGFCDGHLEKMNDDEIDLYEAFLSENDQDLYRWISGQVSVCEPYERIVNQIKLYLINKY